MAFKTLEIAQGCLSCYIHYVAGVLVLRAGLDFTSRPAILCYGLHSELRPIVRTRVQAFYIFYYFLKKSIF